MKMGWYFFEIGINYYFLFILTSYIHISHWIKKWVLFICIILEIVKVFRYAKNALHIQQIICILVAKMLWILSFFDLIRIPTFQTTSYATAFVSSFLHSHSWQYVSIALYRLFNFTILRLSDSWKSIIMYHSFKHNCQFVWLLGETKPRIVLLTRAKRPNSWL